MKRKTNIIVLIIVAIVAAVVIITIAFSAKIEKGLDKAMSAAISEAGYTYEEIDKYSVKPSFSEGMLVYAADFTHDGFIYFYKINSMSGKIISKEKKPSYYTENENPTFGEPATNPYYNEPTQNNEPLTTADSRSQETANTTSQPAPSAPKTTATKTDTVTTEFHHSDHRPESTYIGIDKAKAISLSSAGLTASQVIFTKAKLDKEDGIRVYEIEFEDTANEYEFKIHAQNGKIIEQKTEPLDD